MDVRNCRRCRKIFNYSMGPIYCMSCRQALEEEFQVAKKYIQEHFSEDISLTQISKHVCLSPSYFSRYFKNKTGKNIIDYINDLRIEKSKDLIVSTNENIITIYKTVGFKSKNHYYRLFKERYGVTPLQYRTTITE